MVDTVFNLMAKLNPLYEPKRPGLAALLGLLFGGIGLGIYFRSFIDFLFPIAIAVALTITVSAFQKDLGLLGWLAGALIAAFYGYFRVQESNQRLATAGAVPAG